MKDELRQLYGFAGRFAATRILHQENLALKAEIARLNTAHNEQSLALNVTINGLMDRLLQKNGSQPIHERRPEREQAAGTTQKVRTQEEIMAEFKEQREAQSRAECEAQYQQALKKPQAEAVN